MVEFVVSSLPAWLAVFAIGTLLGTAYFQSLHWTVEAFATGRRSGVTVIVSSLLRTALFLVAFVWLLQGEWQRGLACMFGFIVGRQMVLVRTGRRRATQP